MTLLQQTIQAYLEEHHPNWQLTPYLSSNNFDISQHIRASYTSTPYLTIHLDTQKITRSNWYPNIGPNWLNWLQNSPNNIPYTLETLPTAITHLITQYENHHQPHPTPSPT